MAREDRPRRQSVRDETGTARTLAAGPETFALLGGEGRPVFLGLGPDPSIASALAEGRRGAYIECPEFAAAMGAGWPEAIPGDWERLAPEDLTPELARGAAFYLYRHNPRLFPSFWGPIWARVQLALLPRPEKTAATKTVLLAHSPGGLLEPELARALAGLGRSVTGIAAGASARDVGGTLSAGKPELFLCVNGAGLDDDGLVFSLLEAAGVPVAIWFVDNPFHVLGRFRGPFWKRALLCPTDDAFAPPLRALGAGRVLPLPLAASEHFFGARPEAGLDGRVVFVGRSAFSGRDAFFAGCRVPEELAREARAMLDKGERPDVFWWARRLKIGEPWPGKAIRRAGCGAETAGQAFRADVLTALAGQTPLTVFGDGGWKRLVPEGTDCRGPVDYYGRLPGIYAGAGLVAGATSLLLPRGLTQRHFDVWAAGGCLITDNTPGLDLFPEELVAPVCYATAQDAARLAKSLLADGERRAALTLAWNRHIALGHRYEHRLRTLLECVRAG